jgi:hypothetical protein
MRHFLDKPQPDDAGAGTAWPKEDTHPSWSLPGAQELDEALAALRPQQRADQPAGEQGPGSLRSDAAPPAQPTTQSGDASTAEEPSPRVVFGSRRTPSSPGMGREWAKPISPEPLTPPRQPASQAEPAERLEQAREDQQTEHAGGEPEWLRGRRDPAARAYRRLRRIFPS